jgi:hypothetical protein
MASITIQLRPETEQKLRQQASLRGESLETYLQQLIEREVATANGTAPPAGKTLPSFEEMTAPIARAVDANGMSEDEVSEFFKEVVQDVRAKRRARKSQSP